MKKAIVLILCIAMMVQLTACKHKDDSSEHAVNMPSDKEIKEQDYNPPITPTPTPSKEDSLLDEPSYEVFPKQEENIIEVFHKAVAAPVFPVRDEMISRYELRMSIDPQYIASLKAFSAELSAKALVGREENVMISPINIQMALALAAAGAKGATREEIMETLYLQDKDIDYLATENEKLFQLLYTYDAISKLTIADSLWLDKDIRFRKEYLDTAAKQFYASLYEVDFSDKETGELMSQWIYENTGKLMQPDITTAPEQIFSIISTIYLKDEWLDLFQEEEIETEPFYLTDHSEVACEYLHRTINPYSYVKEEGFLSAKLYTKGYLEVQFILPDEGMKPDDLLNSPQLLEEALYSKEEKSAQINFHIPKFSFGSSFPFKEILRDMGITTAFAQDADFSEAMDTETAYLSEVVHETHVGIDEKGIEAGAFTNLIYFGAAPGTEEVVEFNLNRPFLFVVSKEEVILFLGVVNNPSLMN